MSRVLPILFNTDMVRAILDGRKTVTRRLVKFPKSIQLQDDGLYTLFAEGTCYENQHMEQIVGYLKPPYHPGDILYVRETWYRGLNRILYKANYSENEKFYTNGKEIQIKWRPSIHMPKEAARIWLKVKDVRVERLQEITEEQAKAEGICRLYDDMSKEEYEKWARKVGKVETQEECSFKNYLWHGNFGEYGSGNRLSDAWEYQYSGYANAVGSFSSLWNTTVDIKDWDRYGWDANPWVWVIEFERCEKPEDI